MKWYERLSLAREAKGYKKAHFAKAIGVQPPTITEWERGDVVAPSAANVMKMCKVLNITPEWLMSGPSQGTEGIPEKTYFGTKGEIALAVELMEKMTELELAQIVGMIQAFAKARPPSPPSSQ